MIKTNSVRKLLKSNKTMEFAKIWNELKEEISSEMLLENIDEINLMNDLYTSMIQDKELIMIGDLTWALSANYSLSELKLIHSSILSEELDKISETDNDDADVIAEVIAGIAEINEESAEGLITAEREVKK